MPAPDAQLEMCTIWSRLAAGWKKHDALHTRYTAGVTARMVDGLLPGQQVLDIACGTGDPTLAAAERVGPTGHVLGIDFIDELLDHARAKAAARGLRHAEFACIDGETLAFPPASFDRVTIRWGLMFMTDPAACLARVHRALVPGGVLAVACWASPQQNPWATVLPMVVFRHIEPPAAQLSGPGPFALADPDLLRSLVAGACFTEITVEAIELTMSDFARGEDFVSYRMDTAGPLADTIAALPEALRDTVLGEAAREAERIGGGTAHLGGATWLVTARR